MKLRRFPEERLVALLPYPASDANKYTRGKLYAIGGSAAYPGAICMASRAGARMGAGYVEVVCDASARSLVVMSEPSLVARSWEGFSLLATSAADLTYAHPQACLIGSGMEASDEWQRQLTIEVLQDAVCPVLVDGGAIEQVGMSHACALLATRASRGAQTVFTPHFGEASRLANMLNIAVPTSHDDDTLASFALELSQQLSSVVVLKGVHTLIASFAESPTEVYCMDEGTVALAKAGSGDVLAGMTASLLAQGLPAFDAACVAALLHARCGRAAAEKLTDICVCASDLIDMLPEVLRGLTKY